MGCLSFHSASLITIFPNDVNSNILACVMVYSWILFIYLGSHIYFVSMSMVRTIMSDECHKGCLIYILSQADLCVCCVCVCMHVYIHVLTVDKFLSNNIDMKMVSI